MVIRAALYSKRNNLSFGLLNSFVYLNNQLSLRNIIFQKNIYNNFQEFIWLTKSYTFTYVLLNIS